MAKKRTGEKPKLKRKRARKKSAKAKSRVNKSKRAGRTSTSGARRKRASDLSVGSGRKGGKSRARSPAAARRVARKGGKPGRGSAKNQRGVGDTRVVRTRLRRIRWRTLPGLDTVSDHSGDTNGRPIQGRTIGHQLDNLGTIAPHRTVDGHLYRTKEQLNAKTKRATMFLLIRSTDNTYAVHETLFVSRKARRTGAQWFRWFDRHAFKGTDPDGTPTERDGIIRGNILPGINTRTQKIWEVVGGPNRITKATRGYLGFITHDLRKPIPAKVDRKGNKAKPQGRKNGKNNRRRRRRNAKRKTA